MPRIPSAEGCAPKRARSASRPDFLLVRTPGEASARTGTHDGCAEGGALHPSKEVDRDFVLGKAARDRPDDEPDHAADKDSAWQRFRFNRDSPEGKIRSGKARIVDSLFMTVLPTPRERNGQCQHLEKAKRKK